MNDPSIAETTIWRAASELAAGDRIAAGFLQPNREAAEVLFTFAYPLSADREPFVLVVYRADDSDPDVDYFRADSRIPLEAFTNAAGYGYSREADDPTPVSPARVPLHNGGVVDGGQLVDETPAVAMAASGLTLAADQSRGALAGTTPVVTYFSFGHGQSDPGTGESLLDHYATVVAPTYEACREAMFASRFGRAWSFDYLAGTPRATEWIPRWTEHEVIVAPGTDPDLAESALKAARHVLAASADVAPCWHGDIIGGAPCPGGGPDCGPAF